MFRPGPLEIVLIVVALLLLFGAKRIPEIARSIGQALREFKKGLRDSSGDGPGSPGDDRENRS
ncbi:twin-arginine translocase TatA/TatE family subunit [Candidatus Fermentibacteria bacterium]|nr:twin-arginine translocase TatA/TatE family subunit [Candidatus Fermentibacteria bacterium]